MSSSWVHRLQRDMSCVALRPFKGYEGIDGLQGDTAIRGFLQEFLTQNKGAENDGDSESVDALLERWEKDKDIVLCATYSHEEPSSPPVLRVLATARRYNFSWILDALIWEGDVHNHLNFVTSTVCFTEAMLAAHPMPKEGVATGTRLMVYIANNPDGTENEVLIKNLSDLGYTRNTQAEIKEDNRAVLTKHVSLIVLSNPTPAGADAVASKT